MKIDEFSIYIEFYYINVEKLEIDYLFKFLKYFLLYMFNIGYL